MSYPSYPNQGQPQTYNPYGQPAQSPHNNPSGPGYGPPHPGSNGYTQPKSLPTSPAYNYAAVAPAPEAAPVAPYPHAVPPQTVNSTAFLPQAVNGPPAGHSHGHGRGHHHRGPRGPPALTGALARGYPNEPWFCAACTAQNVDADRFYCSVCESRRPPLPQEVQMANFRMRNHWGRSGWDKYDYSNYNGVNAQTGAVMTMTSPTNTGDTSSSPTNGVEMAPVAATGDEEAGGAIAAAETAGTHADTVGVMGVSQDWLQRGLATGLALFGVYRTVMACLLAIFVPQRCEGEDGIVADCTMQENFQELDTFNVVVVVINFVTLAVSLLHSALVYRRESVFVNMLDEDPTVTNDFLVREDERGHRIVDLYPAVRDTVNRYNKTIMFTATLTLLLYLINVVLSGILIFGYWYAGFQTVTTFITNMALNVNLVFTHWNHSRTGVNKGLALSLYKTDPSVYNNIDRKQRERYFVKRTQLADKDKVR